MSEYTHLFCHEDYVDVIIKWNSFDNSESNIYAGTNKAIISRYSPVLHDLVLDKNNNDFGLNEKKFELNLNKFFYKNCSKQLILAIILGLNGFIDKIKKMKFIRVDGRYVFEFVRFVHEFNILILNDVVYYLLRNRTEYISLSNIKTMIKFNDEKLNKVLVDVIINNYASHYIRHEEDEVYDMEITTTWIKERALTFEEENDIDKNSSFENILFNVISKLQSILRK